MHDSLLLLVCVCVSGIFGTLTMLSALEKSVPLYHVELVFTDINSHIGGETLNLFFPFVHTVSNMKGLIYGVLLQKLIKYSLN